MGRNFRNRGILGTASFSVMIAAGLRAGKGSMGFDWR